MNDNNKALTVVLPAYNEEESLSSYLPELIDYTKDKNWQIIVVNDGSTDHTKDILNAFLSTSNLKVMHHKMNRGYGGALKTGISEVDTEYIVTVDADGQHIPKYISELFEVLLEKDADMVIGSRIKLKSDSGLRSFGKWIIRTIAWVLFQIKIRDLNSGMKIYRTDLLKENIKYCPDSMAFSDTITLAFLNQRHSVIEHPIEIRKRLEGKSNVTYYSAFQTVMEIINIVMLFNPMRIFLPVSVLFFLLGSIWAIPFLILGKGLSVLSSLLMVTSILIFMIGLIAEQIATLRK